MGPRKPTTPRRRAIDALSRAVCPLGDERSRKKAVADLSRTLWSLHPPDVTHEYTDELSERFVTDLQKWLRSSGITQEVAIELAEDFVAALGEHLIAEVESIIEARLTQYADQLGLPAPLFAERKTRRKGGRK